MFSLRNDAIGKNLKDKKPNDTHDLSDGMLVASNQDELGVTIYDCKLTIPAPSPTSSSSPTTGESVTYCLTAEDCKDRHEGSFSQFVSGNYRNHGCFSKGGVLYWGKGGTLEQMLNSSDFLDTAKERVFCSS
jgi:hypothetical protein